MRIDRMLAIVVILLNRRQITAKDLAERFEVGLRTIYRDIEAINLAGIPVVSNQGFGGGYSIPDNFKLNRHYLSISDMRSILAALKGVNAAFDDDEMALVLEKIQGLLPEEERADIGLESETIVIDAVTWDNSKRYSRKIQTLYEKIKNRQLIAIAYLDSNGRATQRQVEPMTLVFKGYAWYLYAFCLKRNDVRLFKLSRIKRISALPQMFTRRDLSYSEVEKSWEETGQMAVEIKFAGELKHIVEEYFEQAIITEGKDGSLRVKTTVPTGPWLEGMILSFGEHAELISPNALRAELLRKIDKMRSIYRKKSRK